MLKLWMPTDNRFVTDLEVKRTAHKTNVKNLEIRIATLKESVRLGEQKLFIFGNNLDFLRSPDAKIVSMEEYRAVQKALDFTYAEFVQGNNELIDQERQLRIENRAIENIGDEIELVRFKLLEFRKRE